MTSCVRCASGQFWLPANLQLPTWAATLACRLFCYYMAPTKDAFRQAPPSRGYIVLFETVPCGVYSNEQCDVWVPVLGSDAMHVLTCAEAG